MLEVLASRKSRRQVYRLATIPRDKFLNGLEFDAQSNAELREMLAEAGYSLGLNELLDGPFRPKRHLRKQTRFSDGSFPVFYSSLDVQTSEVEVCNWFLCFCGEPKSERPAYYQRFSCTFDGVEKDLRSKLADWPDLIDGSNYALCNQLGAEALQSGVDGLVAPSARRSNGANLPVFVRRAIGDPELGDLVSLTLNPDTGKVNLAVVQLSAE